jgi:guanylate kinase
MSGIVYIVSAPSGSGKSTLVNRVMSLVPNLEFSISYTTRKPRGSEVDGREYHFIPREQFENMIASDEFLEYANVFGDYYGTARSVLEKAKSRGKDLLLDIDVQGAAQIKAKMPDAVSIFIVPPSHDELKRRLTSRSAAEGNIRPEVIRRRLDAAGREIENYPKYDYILVNDQLGQSIEQLKAIVLAERIRRSGDAASNQTEQAILTTADECRRESVQGDVQHILEGFRPGNNGAMERGTS